MAIQKVLVPYNFTSYDEKALDFIMHTFASDDRVEVTLFYAYTPIPEIEIRDSPVMERISSNLSHLRLKIHAQETKVKQARERLLQSGFSSDRVHYIFRAVKKNVAQDIIELALAGGFDVVVLNRNPGKITRFFSKSVSDAVTNTLKDITVNVVT